MPLLGVLVATAVLIVAPGAAHAVLPGGMTSNYFYFPSAPSNGGIKGYRNIDSHLTIQDEPNVPGLSGHVDYFWAQQFWFVDGDGGYIGLQSDGVKKGARVGKMAIFSIWDALDAWPPENCETFGGEGVGYSCRVEYPWVMGHEYRLRVVEDGYGNAPAVSGWWNAWIRDVTAGKDTYIGKILVPSGWERLHSAAHVFAEFFGDTASCQETPLAKVRWRQFQANLGSRSAYADHLVTYGNCKSVADIWCNGSTCFHETGVVTNTLFTDGFESGSTSDWD